MCIGQSGGFDCSLGAVVGRLFLLQSYVGHVGTTGTAIHIFAFVFDECSDLRLRPLLLGILFPYLLDDAPSCHSLEDALNAPLTRLGISRSTIQELRAPARCLRPCMTPSVEAGLFVVDLAYRSQFCVGPMTCSRLSRRRVIYRSDYDSFASEEVVSLPRSMAAVSFAFRVLYDGSFEITRFLVAHRFGVRRSSFPALRLLVPTTLRRFRFCICRDASSAIGFLHLHAVMHSIGVWRRIAGSQGSEFAKLSGPRIINFFHAPFTVSRSTPAASEAL